MWDYCNSNKDDIISATESRACENKMALVYNIVEVSSKLQVLISNEPAFDEFHKMLPVFPDMSFPVVMHAGPELYFLLRKQLFCSILIVPYA